MCKAKNINRSNPMWDDIIVRSKIASASFAQRLFDVSWLCYAIGHNAGALKRHVVWWIMWITCESKTCRLGWFTRRRRVGADWLIGDRLQDPEDKLWSEFERPTLSLIMRCKRRLDHSARHKNTSFSFHCVENKPPVWATGATELLHRRASA